MCKNCEKEPVYEFTNQKKLCKNCFIYWFNKKFSETIKKYNLILPKEKITYKKSSEVKTAVLEDNLKYIQSKGYINLVNSGKYDKLALTDNLDSTSYQFIEDLLKNKIKEAEKLKIMNKKEIKPLFFFLDKEIELYAKLRNLKYKKESKKTTEWINFIDELEQKHPELKQAIIQSYLKIFN